MRLPEVGPDGSYVRDVRAWIKAAGGPENAAAKLLTQFRDRAGRFTFAAEKAVAEQPFGAGALAVRSRGAVVTPFGIPRYVLRCLGYPEEKIEAAVTALHGLRGGPKKKKSASARRKR